MVLKLKGRWAVSEKGYESKDRYTTAYVNQILGVRIQRIGAGNRSRKMNKDWQVENTYVMPCQKELEQDPQELP